MTSIPRQVPGIREVARLTGCPRQGRIVARVRAGDNIAVGVVGADLDIEAVPERMELKRAVFSDPAVVFGARSALHASSADPAFPRRRCWPSRPPQPGSAAEQAGREGT